MEDARLAIGGKLARGAGRFALGCGRDHAAGGGLVERIGREWGRLLGASRQHQSQRDGEDQDFTLHHPTP